MSYRRWSSDDFQCDVYVYESVAGGFVTHVAANRVVFKDELPALVPFEPEYVDQFLARHNQVMAMVDAADRVLIGLHTTATASMTPIKRPVRTDWSI